MARIRPLVGRPAKVARVTIEDVAEQAGVSVATVSRVVNGHPDVSPLTRSEVLKVAQDLGYPRLRAPRRAPEERVAGLVALGVPTMQGDDLTQIVTGASEALRDRNAHLVLCDISADPQNPQSLQQRLLQGTTRGALIVYPEDTSDLLALRQSGYPFVVVEPGMMLDESIPSVSVTHWAAAKLATEYLIGLGHTHIGVITGPRDWQVNADRLAGYQAALLGRGLPLTPKLIQSTELTTDGGFSACGRLLARTLTPSAIFVADDLAAVGAMR